MEKQKIKDALIRLSVLKDVDISDKFDKIANAKIILDVGFRCPCCPNDREMDCISRKCFNDIHKMVYVIVDCLKRKKKVRFKS